VQRTGDQNGIKKNKTWKEIEREDEKKGEKFGKYQLLSESKQ
jgi:hypothetical protein